MMLAHSVNVVNTVAKGNPIKVVRQGSIIPRFERRISTREKMPKEIEEKGISRPGDFRDGK